MSENEHEVVVTMDHVRNGVRGCHDRCALALAVRDSVPGASAVMVGCYHVQMDLNGDRYFAPLPPVAWEFRRRFDVLKRGDRSRLGADDYEKRGLAPFRFPLVAVPANGFRLPV